MGNASYGDDSPIAAFATTPGKSALTLIRCSGKHTMELAAKIFSRPEKLLAAAGNTVLHGWILEPIPNNLSQRHRDTEEKLKWDSGIGKPSVSHLSSYSVPPCLRASVRSFGEKVDEVLVSVFRGPKSYTGEDSLDISCHGGGAAGNGVMAVLRDAGFRDALPGEFTFRAFMNGKLDLTRSESVMELVSAKTDRSRRNAINRLSGVLEKEINLIKKNLVTVLSGAEIFLDYSEDEISVSAEEAAGQLLNQALARESLERLRKLAESWRRERIYQEGVLTVIAGRPNAGKSSLFNLLLKEERSIVTEIPGTTRDWIEAWVSIADIPVRLADTAGLRESLDPVEKIGVERSRDLLESAELVLYLIDGAAGINAEDRAFIDKFRQDSHNKPLLVLWNKADITPPPAETGPEACISVSAKTGKGMAELTAAIAEAIGEQAGIAADSPIAVGSQRQKNLISAAAAALQEALNLAGQGEPLDLVAPLLREAVNALGEITGEVSTADILEEMFSKFCVGK